MRFNSLLGIHAFRAMLVEVVFGRDRNSGVCGRGGKVKTTVRERGACLCSGSRSERHKGLRLRELEGCDHTNTKAPDPISTLRLSVLGRE